jgi:hypothetical protein
MTMHNISEKLALSEIQQEHRRQKARSKKASHYYCSSATIIFLIPNNITYSIKCTHKRGTEDSSTNFFSVQSVVMTIEFPGISWDSITCGEVQTQAENGLIDPNTCFDGALTGAVELWCGCVFQCNLCGSNSDNPQAIGQITNLMVSYNYR